MSSLEYLDNKGASALEIFNYKYVIFIDQKVL